MLRLCSTNSSWLQGLWKKADSHDSFQILQAQTATRVGFWLLGLALGARKLPQADILNNRSLVAPVMSRAVRQKPPNWAAKAPQTARNFAIGVCHLPAGFVAPLELGVPQHHCNPRQRPQRGHVVGPSRLQVGTQCRRGMACCD